MTTQQDQERELPLVRSLTFDEREFLHFNPNTSDLVEWVTGFAAEHGLAVAAALVQQAEPVQDNTVQFRGIEDTLEMMRVRQVLEKQAIYLSTKTIIEIVQAAQTEPQRVGLSYEQIAKATVIAKELRSFEADHKPDGWPAVRMSQISELCSAVELMAGFIAGKDPS